MKARLAIITGYSKDPEFVKILLESLNEQTLKEFECYVYASPTSAYFLAEDFIKALSYECFHLRLTENRGFAGNNNYAINAAYREKDHEYIVLINDDTLPDRNFLDELVKTAQSSEEVGAVAAKMVFYQKFITLNGFTSSSQVQDERGLGIRFYENTRFSSSFYPKRFYKEGFHRIEEDEVNPFRWTMNHFAIELPIVTVTESHYLLKLFIRKHKELEKQSLRLMIGTYEVANILLQENKIYYEIAVPKKIIEDNWHHIIQNTGSVITTNESYEIGFGEVDSGQYQSDREVQLFCGGACLITQKALMEVGLFVEGFFSYYEDTDLSLRLGERGYKILYSANALINHYHTGTSKEWSPLFKYYAFRNRIIFSAKTFGFRAFKHAFSERWRETYIYFKLYAKSRFRNQEHRSHLKLNLIILKDSLIGIIKFKPKFLTK